MFLLIERDPECWTQTNDVHGLGGTPHNFADLNECKTACINNRSCIAVDWEPTNIQESCWILTSAVFTDTTEAGIITHHELDRFCLSYGSLVSALYS